MELDKEDLKIVALALRHAIWAGRQQTEGKTYPPAVGFAWFVSVSVVEEAEDLWGRINAELIASQKTGEGEP